MPRTALLRRPLARALPIAVAAGALLFAGPATGSASAKTRHAPCPTAGKTIAKDVGPNVRVWRQGSKLLACTRQAGHKRSLRTLGVWTTGTKVAIGDGDVAFTTTGRSDEHGLVDATAAVDVKSGKRWFASARAALTPDAAQPLTDDRVLRLVVNETATEWVTSRGVVNLAVRTFDAKDEFVPETLPFHVGSRFFLGDAGAAGAAAAARDIALTFGGESDDCGGTDIFKAVVPAIGTAERSFFAYGSGPAPIDPDICNR